MAITDRALGALRRVFGAEREARDQAESPSADAMRYAPSSTYAIWGREDIGGLLSVSQNLMDRYADYEAMNDYPDVRCFTGEMKVYVVGDAGVVTPTPIKNLAVDGAGWNILAFDKKKQQIVKVAAEQPRLSGRNAVILKIKLSNGEALRVTRDHKILTVEEGYIEAQFLRQGVLLVGARAGFDTKNKTMLTVNSPGAVWVSENPVPDGVEDVFDVTTSTHNLLVNGVICHNSAFHYFANDSTQPNLDNGRVVWVKSPDEALVDSADTLIKRRLRLEDDLFSIAYQLCQYGNSMSEVLVTENGVVGLNSLAVPTVRRIEKLNGSLVGFVQDVTGRFTANQDELRRMLAGSMEIPKHVAMFEDWQVCHWRLRSTARRSPYGLSCGEGARWIWKRLVMMQDAVMIYKLCLRGDSQIWTPEGRKAIKDLKEGDEVYSYTTADKLKKTKVVYKKHNGQDKIYRVYGPTREIFANKTHPVLVESKTPEGARRLDYVEVQDIRPGYHRFVTPRRNDDDFVDIGETERSALALGELLRGERLPDRVFQASRDIKRLILRGLTDSLNEETVFYRAERDAVDDFRDLAMQAGYLVTLPLEEEANQCVVALTFCDAPPSAAIDAVEEISTDDIWDIGVEAEEHNFIADGVCVHNTRAPARYAFYVDVTDVPSNRVESFLKRAKRDLKKKKMVNPNNNFLDMRYNPLCLSGDTKIPLLDGTEKTLLEMVDAHERGEQQWVYSVDVNNGNKLVPGKVSWAGGTRKNAQLLKITLDNGESIKVTPDHKMIRRTGEFAEAQTLKVGDSLMPFRRKRGSGASGLGNKSVPGNYDRVYDPATKTWKFTHRIVISALEGFDYNDQTWISHHKDENKLNNCPSNLEPTTRACHVMEHRELNPEVEEYRRRRAAEKLIAYSKTDEARVETAETNRKYDKPALMREAITPEIREKQKQAVAASKKEFWKDKKAAQASKRMRYVFSDEFVSAVRNIILENPKAGAPTIARIANESGLVEILKRDNPTKVNKIKKIHRDLIRWMCHARGFENLKDFRGVVLNSVALAVALSAPDNHKVVAVEFLSEREDTYTLTVEPAHTFAVSCGIAVKNSNDEDFFIAVREGRALSRVEVLSGPDYQNVDDVLMFQKMLHAALMVPRAYLGGDDGAPNRGLLSNEDVRAARVSLQVQRELKLGIERIIRTDFAARGFPKPWDLDFEVMMTVPSNIYELAAMEVKNARADFAARVQPYVSMRWILENVFKMSDDEMTKVEQERQKEAERADRMGMDPSFGSFTGGKPPSPEEQAGAVPGQIPQEGLPPGQGGAPPQPQEQTPQTAAKRYDNTRRLEEQRHRESRRNHQKLVDSLGALQENDQRFARQLAETKAFMKEFKDAALKNVSGRTVAVPSASSRRFSS